MKSFIAALIIAVAVVASNVFFLQRVEEFSEVVGAELEKTVAALEAEDYAQAAAVSKAMGEFVDREKLSLAAILDHTQLDKIEVDIAELRSYIECEVKNDAIAKCRSVDVLIRHLPKNHKLKIENIL